MRYHDWPEKLFAVVKTAQRSKFIWGENDCALFACDCAKAMTGVDYAERFRGKYTTRKEAEVALKKIEGVNNLSELADKYLGERISTSVVQRGDVVLLTVDSLQVLGIVTGNGAVFLALSGGIQVVPLKECSCAWSVK